jgi:chaperonin GroES
MSWQILYGMDDWEEEMDKLLVVLPVIGVAFKKTYYNPETQKNCSQLVLPSNLVVNYWAKSLEQAERKTEVIEMSPRVLRERQLAEVFLDIDLPAPSTATQNSASTQPNAQGMVAPSQVDETTPYTLLEQHTFYDLDGDGYAEPYVITIEAGSKKVLRVVARFDKKGIKMTADGKRIAKINPIEFYTKFPFIPNPDGSFYDVGFGLLLGSINETINTSVNQLIDAGTLSNMQSGFLSKALRMRTGDTRFMPGEWKWVNATGEQLKNGVFPLPVREPSQVLLKLMELLLTSGKELASVAEIFVGKMPGQNTPATTTMASIEQGMKLFTAVYKRIYKALEKEYKKLFELNGVFLDEEEAAAMLDDAITKADYDTSSYDVCPSSDPTAFSATQKLVKAQGLLELLPLGTIDPMEVTKRVLEAQEQPSWENLLVKQQQPNPDAVAAQQEAQLKQAEAQSKMAQREFEGELRGREAQQRMAQEQQAHQQRMQAQQEQNAIEAQRRRMEAADTLAIGRAKGQLAVKNQQEKQAISGKQQSEKGSKSKS